MSANRISGGTLTLGGNNNGYGAIKVFNESGIEKGSWEYNGIKSYSIRIGDQSLTDTYWVEVNPRDNSFVGTSFRFYKNDSISGLTYVDAEIGMKRDSSGINGIYINSINDGDIIGFGGANNRFFWYQSVADFHSTLGNIEANSLNASVNLDMHNHDIKNSQFSGSFTILNNTTTDIYSDINLHGYKITNNGGGLTGTVPFVKSIQTDSNGAVISRTDGVLTFENGILVGW